MSIKCSTFPRMLILLASAAFSGGCECTKVIRLCATDLPPTGVATLLIEFVGSKIVTLNFEIDGTHVDTQEDPAKVTNGWPYPYTLNVELAPGKHDIKWSGSSSRHTFTYVGQGTLNAIGGHKYVVRYSYCVSGPTYSWSRDTWDVAGWATWIQDAATDEAVVGSKPTKWNAKNGGFRSPY